MIRLLTTLTLFVLLAHGMGPANRGIHYFVEWSFHRCGPVWGLIAFTAIVVGIVFILDGVLKLFKRAKTK